MGSVTRLLMGMSLLLCLAGSANADWWSIFKFVGKSAGKSIVRESAEAALRLHPQSGLIALSEGEKLTLATLGASGIVTFTYSNFDELINGLGAVAGDILIPDEFLASHYGLVRRVIMEKPKASRIIDADGTIASLGLRSVGKGTEIVVNPSSMVSMSPNAWAGRGILQQNIMAGLIERMRIIALVPRTDPVQRLFLRDEFGDSVRFVEDTVTFERELARAEKRFVVLIGHVENDCFVLRNSAGQVILNTELRRVQDALYANRSVALMMGCRVACTPTLSGPTQVIDAIATVHAIKSAADLKTPLQFIEAVALRTGPLHIERDLMGRMQVVSDMQATQTETAVRVSAPVLRVFIPKPLSQPLTIAYTLVAVSYFLLMTVYIIGASWIMLLFLGMTPARAWKLGKDLYASTSGRRKDQIEQFSRIELTVLGVVTPAIFILNYALYTILFLLLIVTGVTAIIFGLLINLIGIGDSRQLEGSEDKHASILPRWANAAMPAAFLLLVVAVVLAFLVSLLPSSPEGKFEMTSFWITFAVVSLPLTVALRVFPRILSAFDGVILILLLPTIICWLLVRLAIILPLHWIEFQILRGWSWANSST